MTRHKRDLQAARDPRPTTPTPSAAENTEPPGRATQQGGSARRWVEACLVGDRSPRVPTRSVLVRQCRGNERAVESNADANDAAPLSYGSSRACNATSVGSPADSKSPVALRAPARAGSAVSWCGRFPAGWRAHEQQRSCWFGSARRTSSDTGRGFHAPPFGNPADSESPVALRSPLARGLPVRLGVSCTDRI